MNCPHCTGMRTKKRAKKIKLGYSIFFCLECQCVFNERTGTPFNYLEVPSDIVLLVVFWRLRYKLSLRDVAEMFLERGFVFTHETVREVAKVALFLASSDSSFIVGTEIAADGGSTANIRPLSSQNQ